MTIGNIYIGSLTNEEVCTKSGIEMETRTRDRDTVCRETSRRRQIQAMKAAKHSCEDKREGGRTALQTAWLPLMGTVQKVRPGSLTRGRSL